MYETGVIHGRFQILHNDHVRYLLSGKKLCKKLIVGITNPDPTLVKDFPFDPHRTSFLGNPLTYFERQEMVYRTLLSHGIKSEEFRIVPFPINLPHLYQYYVPLNGIFFLVIYDDWGREKYRLFNSLGITTHIIRDVPLSQKGISGSLVRTLMASDEKWEHLVPAVVARLVKEWDVQAKIRDLYTKMNEQEQCMVDSSSKSIAFTKEELEMFEHIMDYYIKEENKELELLKLPNANGDFIEGCKRRALVLQSIREKVLSMLK